MQRFGRRSILVSAGIFALVAGGVAYAVIPDSGGLIHACYDKQSGQVRIVDPPMPKGCGSKEQAIEWNQRGPSGPSGPSGANGASGPSGPAGLLSGSQLVKASSDLYCFEFIGGEQPCEPGDLFDAGVSCPEQTFLLGGGGGVQVYDDANPPNPVAPTNFMIYEVGPDGTTGLNGGTGWSVFFVILNHDETHSYHATARALCSPSPSP